eukprot:scaffold40091_cov54-Attheya_sp.AAC.2
MAKPRVSESWVPTRSNNLHWIGWVKAATGMSRVWQGDLDTGDLVQRNDNISDERMQEPVVCRN